MHSRLILASNATAVVLWCMVIVAGLWLWHVGVWALATLAEFAGWLP